MVLATMLGACGGNDDAAPPLPAATEAAVDAIVEQQLSAGKRWEHIAHHIGASMFDLVVEPMNDRFLSSRPVDFLIAFLSAMIYEQSAPAKPIIDRWGRWSDVLPARLTRKDEVSYNRGADFMACLTAVKSGKHDCLAGDHS